MKWQKGDQNKRQLLFLFTSKQCIIGCFHLSIDYWKLCSVLFQL